MARGQVALNLFAPLPPNPFALLLGKKTKMRTLDNVLSEISAFSLDDKEILNEILKKRIIEEKRSLIFRDYQEALKNYENGNVKSGSVDDLFNSLSQKSPSD